MAKGSINLHIGTSCDASGFTQLNAAMAKSAKSVSRVNGAIQILGKSGSALYPIMSKISGIGAILSGGIFAAGGWMLLATALGKVAELFGKIKDEINGIKTERMSKFMRGEMEKGHSRRLQKYEQMKVDKAQAAAEAKAQAEEDAKAQKAADDAYQIQANSAMLKNAQGKRAVEMEALRRGMIGKSGVELAQATAAYNIRSAQGDVTDAQEMVRIQKQFGEFDWQKMQEVTNALALAEEKLLTVQAEEAQKIKEAIAARDKEIAATKKAAAEKEKRERLEAQRKSLQADQEAIRARGEAAADKIQEQIAAANAAAPAWQQGHQGAEAANGFGDWQHQQEVEAHEQERNQKRQANKFELARKEYLQIWERTHDPRNGRLLSTATKSDLERMQKLQKFGELLNPANDPAKKAEQLEKQLKEAQLKTSKNVEEIAKKMKDLGI